MAEQEAARPDGIDAVAITTPNNSHHAIAVAFISDKPLATTLTDALDLVRRQKEIGLACGGTYSYAESAMVRQARQMVRNGVLIRRLSGRHLPPTISARIATISVPSYAGGR